MWFSKTLKWTSIPFRFCNWRSFTSLFLPLYSYPLPWLVSVLYTERVKSSSRYSKNSRTIQSPRAACGDFKYSFSALFSNGPCKIICLYYWINARGVSNLRVIAKIILLTDLVSCSSRARNTLARSSACRKKTKFAKNR